MTPSLVHGPQLFEMMGATGGGSSDSDSRPTILTANATPGTDGAWSEMIASTSFDYEGLHVIMCRTHPAATARMLVDVAVGTGGAEQVILPDLQIMEQSTNRCNGLAVYIPLRIPAGKRIAARIHRAQTASATVDLQLIGAGVSGRGFPPFSRATMYGTDLANYRGTLVDPGTSANTRGTRAEIVASTTNPIRCLYVFVERAVTGASNTTDNSALLEIAVGASSAEVILVPPLSLDMSQTHDHYNPVVFGPFFVNLPAGVRLSAVAQANFTLASAREMAVSLLGLD